MLPKKNLQFPNKNLKSREVQLPARSVTMVNTKVEYRLCNDMKNCSKFWQPTLTEACKVEAFQATHLSKVRHVAQRRACERRKSTGTFVATWLSANHISPCPGQVVVLHRRVCREKKRQRELVDRITCIIRSIRRRPIEWLVRHCCRTVLRRDLSMVCIFSLSILHGLVWMLAVPQLWWQKAWMCKMQTDFPAFVC